MKNSLPSLNQANKNIIFRRRIGQLFSSCPIALIVMLLCCSAGLAKPDSLSRDQNNSAGNSTESPDQLPQPPQMSPLGYTISINGQALLTPPNRPEQRGDRLFLPISSIAQALGDKLTIDPQKRSEE